MNFSTGTTVNLVMSERQWVEIDYCPRMSRPHFQPQPDSRGQDHQHGHGYKPYTLGETVSELKLNKSSGVIL